MMKGEPKVPPMTYQQVGSKIKYKLQTESMFEIFISFIVHVKHFILRFLIATTEIWFDQVLLYNP